MDTIRKVLSYNDVLLVPRHSELEHLSDCDIEYEYKNIPSPFTSVPIVNAPMDKITNIDLLRLLNTKFGLPVTIDRWFNTVEEQIRFFEDCRFVREESVFVSVGIVAKWKEWIDKLNIYRTCNNKRFGILVDVANGDTKCCVETVKHISNNFYSNTNIMAGNVATRSGFLRLQDAGANFIRCGIGGGHCCETRTVTGMGVPTLTSVIDCSKVKDAAYLVADGGISNCGDLCKAMNAGADMVMMGSVFAATNLSHGTKLDKDGYATAKEDDYAYVEYSGMASKEAIQKLNSKKSSISIEGVSGYIPYTGTTEEVVENMFGNMRSSMAYYAGCKNWEEYRRKVKMIEITSQGWNESLTHVETF